VIGVFALLLLFAATSALAWWQFVRSIRSRRVEIKGWVFEQAEQPIHYWSNLIMFLIGAVVMSAATFAIFFGLLTNAKN